MGGERGGRPASRECPEGLIGWVEGRTGGALLLCVGGLHGNEPAGVRALEEVVAQVETRRHLLAGDFVAVAGNLRALGAGRRFLSYDLNRAWTSARIEAARGRQRSEGGGVPAEDAELFRMLAGLEQVSARRRGPVYVLDLHSTSGGGGPFSTAADMPAHRRFTMSIPVPMVRQLNQHLEGTLTHYLDRLGYTAAVFESGQHEEPEARVRAASAVWLAIRAAGLLADPDAPEARRGYRALERECRRLPRLLEMTYRHPIEDEDRYVMRPGFRNFQPIRAGEVVGDDRHGEVVAPKSGRILMPLYQELGEEGFFVVRDAGFAEPAVQRPARVAGMSGPGG